MKKIFSILAAVGLAGLSVGQAQILSYNFNQGTGSATNTGSAGSGGNLTLGTAVSSVPGVSGQPGDFAYSGSNNVQSYGATSGPLASMNNLSAFTITGWLNISAWRTSRILQTQSAFGNGFILSMETATPGQLTLRDRLGNLMVSDSVGGVYDSSFGSWMFVAITWDGASLTTTDAVKFYYGTTSLASSMVSDIDRSSVTNTMTSTGPILVGNSGAPASFLTYEYVGRMDNLSVYNSVLNASAIEAIRQSALVPEPSVGAMLGLGAICGLGMLRHRRRSMPVLRTVPI